jgi:NAD(P)-dependent dehydrogenase (short-subunit alcohol dehydrogenase family)
VAEEIRSRGGIAVANTQTIETSEGAQLIVASALDNFDRVDILVNNAGIFAPAPFSETDLNHFMRHLAVHLIGCFNMCQAVWPTMIAQHYGRIVNITSSALLGHPAIASYSAAKSGQIGLTKSLALAGISDGILVNAIAPVATTRLEAVVGDLKPCQPENIAAGVALLSHESCPSNGEIIGLGQGHAGRLFIADTLGFTMAGTLTPEGLLRSWDKVTAETDYYVPRDCSYHANRLRDPQSLSDLQARGH